MTTKRKVRDDFDNSQPITVNVSGCSEDVKKQVIQSFFDVGLFWRTDDRDLSPVDGDVNSYTNLLHEASDDKEAKSYVMWAIEAKGITPAEFFAMVYEDEPQGHPHAELMMQYAEDAKTHAEPWRLWQLKNKKQLEWFDCTSNPNWDIDLQYRQKIKTHLVHGVEVPDLRIEPINGDVYYHPSPSNPNMYEAEEFDSTIISDIHKLENNLCYEHTEAGKQAAILHAKAMLGIAGE